MEQIPQWILDLNREIICDVCGEKKRMMTGHGHAIKINTGRMSEQDDIQENTDTMEEKLEALNNLE